MRIVIRLVIVVSLIILTHPAMTEAREHYSQPGSIHLDREGEKWVQRTLNKMSTEEKVGQLFMVWARAEFLNVDSPEYHEFTNRIDRYHIGSFALTVPVDGPFLIKGQPYEAAMLVNRLQQQSKLPLLIAADFESGLSSRLNGTTVFPQAMAFGAAGKADYAESFGKIVALEARAIGVHWNFFPVADVNSNPANPIINTRSFGENPQQVGEMVAAYIRGAHSNGMLTTAKHFPGHGDTATDSHLGVAQVSGDRARLDSVELPPFRQAIAAGVDAVMVAHVAVPALESDPNKVATTSPAIVTQLLKKQLVFQGIVVSDALDMAALTSLYAANIGRAAVDAFKAGNDVLLIPPNLDAAYRAMLAAIASGEISLERLDSSVRKILQAKASLGLQRARLVDITAIDRIIGQPENVALAQEISDDAITLVRDNGKILPMKAVKKSTVPLPYQAPVPITNRVVAVVFSDDVRLESGRTLERQLHIRAPDAHIFYVDSRIAAATSPDILRAVDEAETVLTAVYAVPSPGVRGSGNALSQADATHTLLQTILDHAAAKTALISVGSPYLARDFPAVQNYVCTFSSAPVSETSVVKALFGEIPIRGHLPVSIPNIADRGAGIEKSAN
ncbi:MAG TPA: glycoside hydrolase family 3 protein [Terriglobales bacterium]|jgi:beta-N-acetylhexosaminidase|nr:glycoside hydrolase family 3 protein [Terriglobales bacterium]